MHESILIIDFGSQVTQLIARRVRESGVYSEIAPYNKADEVFKTLNPKGVILSGGPASVHKKNAPYISDEIIHSGLPILGICYGEQLICYKFGAKVENTDHREFGRAHLEVIDHCDLFDGIWNIGDKDQVWMSHGDNIISLPDGFRVVGKSSNAPFAAIASHDHKIYGVQFHPEVVHTLKGRELLNNFTHKICGCSGDWTMKAFLEEELQKIKDEVGNKKVICGLSGGVDSSVVAVLLHKAIGDQLQCVFVDNGLMRAGEPKQVVELFSNHYNIPLIHIDATDEFLDQLCETHDPERKRKIIGETFIEVFEREANKIKDAEFLAQGTLYPDVIESISFTGSPSVTIKSHHNVGGLPEKMNLKLIEPLRELFKDEVRSLGRELNIDNEFISRHPFPGPGLAIRVPGKIDREKLDILRKADVIYLDEIRKNGLYDEIWQAFCVLLPVRTVGVMGDSRSYDYVCALRAVTSTDGMTADYYHYSHEFLINVSNRIINEVNGINRVVYDITSKPPGTIEWE